MTSTNNEQSSDSSKPGALSNIKNMIKIGSDKLKEKFTNIFSKKTTPRNSQDNQLKSPTNNTAGSSSSTKKEDNNEAFKIEDDMDNNDLSFHINNEEDDEDEESVKTNDLNKVPEESKKEIVNKSSSKSIPSNHEKILKEIEDSDISTYVHKVYLKGSFIETEGFPAIPCKKIKKKSKILSFMGFGKNKKDELLKYILLLDDNFIYLIKDENNIPDKTNPNLKKVGNRYNLRLLSNVIFKIGEDSNKIISLVFSKEEYSPADSEKIKKDFCFENNSDHIFMSYLNVFLTKINKPQINLLY